VALRQTDRLIGDCGAHVQAEDSRQAEIGFTLAPQHQGYGYATEAVPRLLHYLLIERGKHRVRATCDDRNMGSAAVLERVGMRREGHLLESTWPKGEWTNDLYAVLRREWSTGLTRRFGIPQAPLDASPYLHANPSMNLNVRLQVRVLPRVRARRPHRRHLQFGGAAAAASLRRALNARASRYGRPRRDPQGTALSAPASNLLAQAAMTVLGPV
jgi:hypothetical protein